MRLGTLKVGLKQINALCVHIPEKVVVDSSVTFFHLARVSKGKESKAGINREALVSSASPRDIKRSG